LGLGRAGARGNEGSAPYNIWLVIFEYDNCPQVGPSRSPNALEKTIYSELRFPKNSGSWAVVQNHTAVRDSQMILSLLAVVPFGKYGVSCRKSFVLLALRNQADGQQNDPTIE
jgi:hypothetical protein